MGFGATFYSSCNVKEKSCQGLSVKRENSVSKGKAVLVGKVCLRTWGGARDRRYMYQPQVDSNSSSSNSSSNDGSSSSSSIVASVKRKINPHLPPPLLLLRAETTDCYRGFKCTRLHLSLFFALTLPLQSVSLLVFLSRFLWPSCYLPYAHTLVYLSPEVLFAPLLLPPQSLFHMFTQRLSRR